MNTFTLSLIVIGYLLSLAYLGFLGYKKTTSTSDYLVGGRQMNPIVMALSYGATFISASAIVGFGGVAAAFGMGIQWLCFLNMFIGVVIAFIFFGLRTRRMGAKLNVSTFPQLLGRHFRSRNIQVFIAAVIFIGMPLYAAVVMKGGAVFIEQIFQIDFNISLLIFTLVIAAYVIAGGMKGVMYTDALQAVIMFACMLFLLFSLYQVLDMNFTEANKELTAIAPLVPEKFKALGHQGWTAMPVTGSPQWLWNNLINILYDFRSNRPFCFQKEKITQCSGMINSTYGYNQKETTDKHTTRSRGKLTNVIRLGVLFSILVSYIICYMLPHDIIARISDQSPGTDMFLSVHPVRTTPCRYPMQPILSDVEIPEQKDFQERTKL